MTTQKPFHVDDDFERFRSALEETFQAVGLPYTRYGEGYRSPITQWCFEVAYGVVNRMGLFALPKEMKAEKDDQKG